MPDTLTVNRDIATKAGTGTVSVGWKHPHGIELWVNRSTKGPRDPVTGEYPEVFVRETGPVVLNGTGNAAKKGIRVIGGYALTTVDASFMDKWLAQNPNFPAVKNGLLILGKRSDDVRAEAKEKAAIQGLEPIDPEHPERHNGPDTPRQVAADNYEGRPEQAE